MPHGPIRNAAGLEALRLLWPIHFPPGKAFDDDQAVLCMRDALVLADGWLKLAELSPLELAAVTRESLSNPQQPAAEATVEGEKS